MRYRRDNYRSTGSFETRSRAVSRATEQPRSIILWKNKRERRALTLPDRFTGMRIDSLAMQAVKGVPESEATWSALIREKCNDPQQLVPSTRLPFLLHERVKFPAATPYAPDIIISLV